jgi:hypothetical protein
MEKSSQGYHMIPRRSAAEFLHPHQLPLFGVAYDPERDEYGHTINGLVCPESGLTTDTAKDEIEGLPVEQEDYEPPFNVFLGV